MAQVRESSAHLVVFEPFRLFEALLQVQGELLGVSLQAAPPAEARLALSRAREFRSPGLAIRGQVAVLLVRGFLQGA